MKFKSKALISVAIALGLVAGGATAANAHHNTITGVATCNTAIGNWDATWKIQNSEPLIETITASNLPGLVSVGTSIAKSATLTVTETLTTNAPRTLTLSSKWANNQTATNSGSLVFNTKVCERTKPDQPAPYGEPYSTTSGDCTTLQHVTVSGTKKHTFVFNPTTWKWDEVVTVVPNADVVTPFTDAELAACAGDEPKKDPTFTEWSGGAVTCANPVGEKTRTRTDYTYTREGAKWVESVKTTVETERVSLSDAELDACAGEQPENKVVNTATDWQDGTYACGATQVKQTRTSTSTVTPFVLVNHMWVEDTEHRTSSSVVETRLRDLAASEQKACGTGGGLVTTGTDDAIRIGLIALLLVAAGLLIKFRNSLPFSRKQ